MDNVLRLNFVRFLICIYFVGYISAINGYSKGNTDEDVPVSLLWHKEFETEIHAISISSDGKILAVTLASFFKGEKRVGTKLVFLNTKGDIQNEYEHIMEREDHRLDYMTMSDDGKYVVCTLFDIHNLARRTMFFNSNAELLWSIEAMGTPIISSDGRYVLIIPDIYEGEFFENCYLHNAEGERLFEMVISGINYPHISVMPIIGCTSDLKYISFDGRLYDRNKNILLDLERDFDFPYASFTKFNRNGSIGMVEVYGPDKGLWSARWDCLICLDLKQRKILWGKESKKEKLSPPYTSTIYYPPFHRYYLSQNDKYLITFADTKLPYQYEVKVYDILSGNILSPAWQTDRSFEGEIRMFGEDCILLLKGDDKLFCYKALTGQGIELLSIPELRNYGRRQVSKNNKYILIKVKKQLYLYENKNPN